MPMNIEEIQKVIDQHYWWHTIDLGNGLWTNGAKTREIMQTEYDAVFTPLHLESKSVLDIGTWNGAFAIEAHRRGAASVTALDHYVWNHPHFRGREAFDLVFQLMGIDCHAVDRDLDAARLDLSDLGTFDVVLFLGVFYHLRDPIASLREVSKCARHILVVESHIEKFPDERPAMVFYPSDELCQDASNWWGPNRACLVELLKHFGFSRVYTTPGSSLTREIFHAYRA